MKKKFKLGVIGCGSMATAILKGVVLSSFLSEKKIIVSDAVEANLDKIGEELGVYTCDSNKYVAENSEFVLIAVNPQNLDGVFRSFGDYVPEKIISIMAGVAKSAIKARLGSKPCVARCLPNLPCSIGSGTIAIDMYDFNSNRDDIEFISYIFGNLGRVISLPESKFNAVAAISASGPAYAFMFIDSLIDSGVAQGLTRDEAKVLAVQTVLGSAELVQREEQSISDLIMQVCSKGGATVEAVKVLEENDFRGTVAKAVDACAKRASELSGK